MLQGGREKLLVLDKEPDLLFIDRPAADRADIYPAKAPLAVGALVLMLVSVIAGWLELPTAAVLAATLMVLTGVISMDDAQHSIELKAIFIIAAMLPLGLAMEKSGTAEYLASLMVQFAGKLGPTGVLAGITLFA